MQMEEIRAFNSPSGSPPRDPRRSLAGVGAAVLLAGGLYLSVSCARDFDGTYDACKDVLYAAVETVRDVLD